MPLTSTPTSVLRRMIALAGIGLGAVASTGATIEIAGTPVAMTHEHAVAAGAAIGLTGGAYAPRSVAEFHTEIRTDSGRFWCQNHPAPGIRNPPDGGPQALPGAHTRRPVVPRPRFAQCL